MKITFIRPNMSEIKSNDAMQPLAFAVLAALTPKNIEIEFFDDRIESINFSTNTDLIALSIETYTAKRAYQIATKFKKRNIPVIMGGFHASALPDEVLQYADSVAIGDAETTWPQIINDMQNNKLKKKYLADNKYITLNSKYDRRIFENKKYNKIIPVQWARGCPHSCNFCSINSFYSGKQYFRPIDDVVNEIKYIKNNTIFFVDDNLFHSLKKIHKFLEKLTPLKIKWVCQISIEISKYPDLIVKMKLAGCIAVIIGIESINTNNLLQMNKQWNTDKNFISEAINLFKNNKIMVYGSFVFGYDCDTLETINDALHFAQTHKLFIANFNPLHPLPGTDIYKKFLEDNRLIHPKWWLDDTYYYGKSIFKPKNFTEKEFEDKIFNTRKKFNSIHSIIKRAIDWKTNASSLINAFIFIIANFTNRKEIFRKQKLKFGGLK